MEVMADLSKLTEQNTNVRNYLLKNWGYTDRMVDEVMRTGQTPHRAVFLDDETMVLGKKVTTTMERKDNLCNYLMDFWGYSKQQVDEVGETGETPAGKPSMLPAPKLQLTNIWIRLLVELYPTTSLHNTTNKATFKYLTSLLTRNLVIWKVT